MNPALMERIKGLLDCVVMISNANSSCFRMVYEDLPDPRSA